MLVTPWRVSLLGGLSLCRGPQAVSRFATAKTAALLAYLVLFPRPHAREELVDLLWPDADTDAGRNSFKQALASLRRQLEPPGTPGQSVLLADRLHVSINPPAVQTDVRAFEAALRRAQRATAAEEKRLFLTQALDLYGGDLLPGFYDDWVLDERHRLTALAEQARACLSGLSAARAPAKQEDTADDLFSGDLSAPLVRLPVTWTRFFGRWEEQAHLDHWLAESSTRLVTITGPGGAGKTRLAVETARRIASSFDGGVVFVALADLTDPALLPAAIAEALRLEPNARCDPRDQIAEFLAARPRFLLVLDNLEQIADSASLTVQSLLARTPSLSVLAASRHRLEIPGERELPLPPLPVPLETELAPAELMESPAVGLFVDRAQVSRPDFQLTVRNSESVAGLCRDLEGLPLALELAAAWAQALTPAQMRQRLEEKSAWLVARRKDVPERHRTLWAMVAWSFDLLPAPLQKFWTRLSVFRGGWTPEDAAAVCDEPSALHALTQLRARSLVISSEDSGSMRFRMLETLRAWAWNALESAEQAALARRHAAYFHALAEEAKPRLKKQDQAVWLDRLGAEHDNLRAALEALRSDPGSLPVEMSLAAALYDFWYLRGHVREASEHYSSLLSRPGADNAPAAVLGAVINSAGLMSAWQGKQDEAQVLFERGLALMRAAGNDNGEAVALSNLGLAARRRDDYEAAVVFGRQALALRRRMGDDHGAAIALSNIGIALEDLGRLDEAEAALTESLQLRRALGDLTSAGISLTNLGSLYAAQGRLTEARACCRESLCLQRDAGSVASLLFPLLNLAGLDHAAGLWERAARLWGAASALSAAQGVSHSPAEQAELQAQMGDAQAQMGDDAFARAWAEGESLTVEQAIAFALQTPDTAS